MADRPVAAVTSDIMEGLSPRRLCVSATLARRDFLDLYCNGPLGKLIKGLSDYLDRFNDFQQPNNSLGKYITTRVSYNLPVN